MRDGRGQDLLERPPQLPVAAEMPVRTAPPVRHEPVDVHHQEPDACEGDGAAEEPLPSREREPHAKADDRDRGVFPPPRGERQRHGAPAVPAAVKRVRRADEQRDREGLGMDVPDVDAVQRRVEEVQEREARGQSLVLEALPREREDGEAARGQDQRLPEQQRERAGDEPGDRDEEVEHGREVIAPGVHLGQTHPGAAPLPDAPDDLDVIAEIERVGLKRHVPRHRDEREAQRVGEDAGDDGALWIARGQPDRPEHHPEGHHHDASEHDVLGARQPGAGHREPSGHDDHGRERRQREAEPVEDQDHDPHHGRARRAGPGRLERRRPHSAPTSSTPLRMRTGETSTGTGSCAHLRVGS